MIEGFLETPDGSQKLRRLEKALNADGGLSIITARSVEERQAYIQNLDELIALADAIRQNIQSTM